MHRGHRQYSAEIAPSAEAPGPGGQSPTGCRDDHARALWAIVRRGRVGQKYNVGGRNEQTNLAVVQHVCALLDQHHPAAASYSRQIAFVTDRPGHDQRYAIDASKLENELGWRANETFASGIAKTVRWYLDNETWWGPLRKRVYRGQRLGLPSTGDASTSIES